MNAIFNFSSIKRRMKINTLARKAALSSVAEQVGWTPRIAKADEVPERGASFPVRSLQFFSVNL